MTFLSFVNDNTILVCEGGHVVLESFKIVHIQKNGSCQAICYKIVAERARNFFSCNYEIISYTSIMFPLKRMLNLFLLYTYYKMFVYVLVLQLSPKLLFCDILRIICHIDFICSSINFN